MQLFLRAMNPADIAFGRILPYGLALVIQLDDAIVRLTRVWLFGSRATLNAPGLDADVGKDTLAVRWLATPHRSG
jgi:hypothetical protein